MAKRNDVHAPSSAAFDPECYVFYGAFDTDAEYGDQKARRQAVSALVDQGYKSGPGSSSQCGHCGAYIRYAALLARADVKEFIFVGEQCLGGRFELTKAEFDSLRKAAKLNRERKNRAEIKAQNLADNPWLAEFEQSGQFDNFLSSLLEQASDGKQLTAKQSEVGARVWAKVQEQQAAAKVLTDAGVAAPEGKVTVTGEVKSVKWQDSPYGAGQLKMLVLADEGYKVWSTVPRSLQGTSALVSGSEWKVTEDVQAGQRVTFTATLVPSSTDPLFAIAKRPTKASIIDAVVAA